MQDDEDRLKRHWDKCMDIVVMMCKDSKIPPKDDYTNINLLKNSHFNNVEPLIEANGLRNRLILSKNPFLSTLITFPKVREGIDIGFYHYCTLSCFFLDWYYFVMLFQALNV